MKTDLDTKSKLVIGRHPYGLLKMPGAKRLTIALSPDGAAALEQMATCSRAAVVDKAVRLFYVLLSSSHEDGRTIAVELAKTVNYGPNAPERLYAIAGRFFNVAQELEMLADGLLLDLIPE